MLKSKRDRWARLPIDTHFGGGGISEDTKVLYKLLYGLLGIPGNMTQPVASVITPAFRE